MTSFAPKFALAAVALAACAVTATSQAAVVITTTPAPVVDSPGLTGFATTGAMMNGLSITATFSGGLTETVAWSASGATSGGVTGTGWGLSLADDSFSTPWLFTFGVAGQLGQLTHLVMSGTSGFTIFDRTEPSEGTPGSAQGLDFAFDAGCDGCNATVNYSGQTGIGGAAPLGDLWQVVDITFTDATGPRADWSFVQDTDNDIRAMVPEPETYALMLGGLGLLSVLAKRRRRG
jgi:hypothetical protein